MVRASKSLVLRRQLIFHTGPAGQPYYYHVGTQESTYIRPLPSFPTIPQAVIPQPQKKKEKPLLKTPIPGTEWLRVKTTEGNIFYSHKAKKQSLWTVPDEIKDAVEALERAEGHENAQAKEVEKLSFEEEQELKRLKAEMQGVVKRKAEEPQPLDELVISKKARVEEEEDEVEGERDEDEEESEEEEEEEWQREAAAQLAAEAEEEKKRLEEEVKEAKEAEETEARAMQEKQLNMPDRVDLSLEEAKALFKVCH